MARVGFNQAPEFQSSSSHIGFNWGASRKAKVLLSELLIALKCTSLGPHQKANLARRAKQSLLNQPTYITVQFACCANDSVGFLPKDAAEDCAKA
jgi:hypothetical protein